MSDDHELVMPFVCVTSKGGPYDDAAFVAGYRCGLIDNDLSHHPETLSTPVEPSLRVQMDLLAMRHDYVLVIDSEETDGWLQASFWRKPAFGLFDRDELGDDPS